MTTPALAALLCLGYFPPLSIVLLGMLTAFAGYTAVYAVNDLTDYGSDRKKAVTGGFDDSEDYLDGVLIRHPMAKGALSFSSGLAWALGWALVAMGGAYFLNPVCLWIFLAGCILEIIYCRLGRVTPLRALVNGIVKTCGPLAAVYAVNPAPSIWFLVVLFLWIFLWEIGGQNIPADWTDIEEDRQLNEKTIPTSLGLKRAGLLSLSCLLLATFLVFAVFRVSPLTFGFLYLLAALGINIYLLLLPALHLAETRKREMAMALFNRASYYPLAVFVLVLVRMVHLALIATV
jgi:4-hydroxybenzoate polyprenyltransferase